MTATNTVYVYTTSPKAPAFEFDVTTEVSKDISYTPTKRPIENTGNVNDHIYRQPWKLNTDGMVAVTPISPRTFQPTPSDDPAVLADMQKALEELADKRGLVTVVCDLYTGPAAITSLRFAKGVADGHALRATIGLAEMDIAKTQTAQVDPSRLKRKVNRRQKNKGGQKATEQPAKNDNRSLLAKGVDKLTG